MSYLRDALADYLTLRRALGYKMDKAERLLGQFTIFAEEHGDTHIRTGRRWSGQPSPLVPPRSGHPDVWPRFASLPGTCKHLTQEPRCRLPICCQHKRAARRRISIRRRRLRR